MNLLLFLSLNIITLPCFGRKRETHKNRLNFTLTHGCPSVLPGYEKDFVRSDEIFLPNRSSAKPSHKRIAFLKILLQLLLQARFTAHSGRDDARLSAAQFKSECERSLPADHAGALPPASLRICTADRLFELSQYRFSFLHRPVPHTIYTKPSGSIPPISDPDFRSVQLLLPVQYLRLPLRQLLRSPDERH